MNALNYIQFLVIFAMLGIIALWKNRALNAEEEVRKFKK